MTVVFYADVSPLSDPVIFDAHFRALPDFRKQKTAHIKQEKSKKLSLGAGIVLQRVLEEFGCNIHDAGFRYAPNGMPYPANHPDLHISISHSESIAMCAVSEYEIGVDVEHISHFREDVCRRFFAKSECDYILSNPDTHIRTERFFRIWTLKESYSKLTGKGIGDFRNFEIDAKSAPPQIIRNYIPDAYFFAEPEIPLYKTAVCIAKEDRIRFEQINITKELLS